MNGGETLIIRGGTYTETISSIPSGSPGASTNIVGAAGEQVTILPSSGQDVVSIYDSSYILLDNLIIDASNVSAVGVRTGGNGFGYAHFITLQNSTVRNSPKTCITEQGPTGANSNLQFINLDVYSCGSTTYDHGIYLTARDSLIERSRIHGAAAYGIHLYSSGSGGVDNNIVRYNQAYNNGSAGILLGGGMNNVAHTNIVWNNPATHGILIAYGGNQYSKVYNNTVYSNGGCIGIWDGINSDVKNNICWQNAQNVIGDFGTGSSVTNNLFQDPRFVDQNNLNFHLTSGSPAINAGVCVNITSDFAGNPVPPQGPCDIGAFEYVR